MVWEWFNENLARFAKDIRKRQVSSRPFKCCGDEDNYFKKTVEAIDNLRC